jgi:hypothetical protein
MVSDVGSRRKLVCWPRGCNGAVCGPKVMHAAETLWRELAHPKKRTGGSKLERKGEIKPE